MAPRLVIHPEDLNSAVAAWRRDGETIGFVPTMGALHAGHLDLVRQAKEKCSRVVVSIFVNPLQFGPSEDFEKYPRTLSSDMQKLTEFGKVDVVFAPNAATIYPTGFQTHVTNRQMSSGLCGGNRPGHFDGVLTVVLKLFNLVHPTHAFFGKKDYQQFRLIHRMVDDLAHPISIIGCETVREADGLAMSSRNIYLNADERAQAPVIRRALLAARDAVLEGTTDPEALASKFSATIASESPLGQVQYAEIRSMKDLSPVSTATHACVMLAAVKFPSARLIDNIEFSEKTTP